MQDFRSAEPEEYATIMAMIPLAEGKPAVHVDGLDGSVFVCRRLSKLHVVPEEWTFYGECDWVDPPEARPPELTDGLAISCGDCLQIGPGWFYDGYFSWYMVYDSALVARSLEGDHSWVSGFLAEVQPRKDQ